MSSFAELFAALDYKEHELDWTVCSKCGEEVAIPTLDTTMLKQNVHTCRRCSYGDDYRRLAQHVDQRSIYAAVLKRRYWVHEARRLGTHASHTARDD